MTSPVTGDGAHISISAAAPHTPCDFVGAVYFAKGYLGSVIEQLRGEVAPRDPEHLAMVLEGLLAHIQEPINAAKGEATR